MNEHEIRILYEAFKNYTGEEIEEICAVLKHQGYEQTDLPWLFHDYDKAVLMGNCQYAHEYKPLGPMTDPYLISSGRV